MTCTDHVHALNTHSSLSLLLASFLCAVYVIRYVVHLQFGPSVQRNVLKQK